MIDKFIWAHECPHAKMYNTEQKYIPEKINGGYLWGVNLLFLASF